MTQFLIIKKQLGHINRNDLQVSQFYIISHKNVTLFTTITLSFLEPLLCFLYQLKQEWMLYSLLT